MPSEPYIGEIFMVGFNFAPRGYALCNGQLLSIQQNAALFSILGTTYGGDGIRTFALPNLQGSAPVHVGGGIVLGQTGGEATHTLTSAEIPTHLHTVTATSAAANSGAPNGAYWASGGQQVYASSANAAMANAAIATSGGSQAHDNMPPYLVLNFVIALQGVFPSRN